MPKVAFVRDFSHRLDAVTSVRYRGGGSYSVSEDVEAAARGAGALKEKHVDLVVALEKAALKHLKDDTSVTAVIPGTQIYTSDGAPPTPPKPFAKPGTPIAGPLTGHRRRRDIRFSIYVRADARRNDQEQPIETARDHMGRCVAAIAESLYRARLPITGGTAKLVLINDIRRMVDGEQDAMEANIEFRARTMAG